MIVPAAIFANGDLAETVGLDGAKNRRLRSFSRFEAAKP